MTALEAAARYVSQGFFVVPIPVREKAPKIQSWPSLRLATVDLPKFFNGAPSNIGLILGDDYGTADVDLDCTEALVVASEFLPETGMVFGHASKPASHFVYRCDPAIRTKRFLDPIDKSCIIEARCQKADGTIGLQTVAPPSIHPSGEKIEFEPGCDGYPANVDAPVLLAGVAKVAAAALLVRQWPGEKQGRNQAFLALAGTLARSGWPLDTAIHFHRALYRALWRAQADFEASRAEVVATFEKHGSGLKTTGGRSLADLMDKRVIHAVLSWLGIQQQSGFAPVRDRDEDAAAEAGAHPHSGRDHNQRTRTQQQGKATAPSESMEDLMTDETITVPELMVEGLLPKRGLALLGGRPKDGKTWFACEIALSVVTGQPLGGWLKVPDPGRVHLWALEDQNALTKDKVVKLLNGSRPDGLRDLRVFQELPQPILRGGDQIIRAALKEHPAELVILDSLFKLTGAQQQNSDISQRDYDVIDRVRRIALEFNCAALIVMHTKKGARGGNPIENIIGTSGTSAAADVVIELKRTSIREGRLTVVGRLVPQEDYELAWHAGPDEWGWTIESAGDDASFGETMQEVVAYLEAQGPTKPASIATALHKSFGSVWMALQRLQQRRRAVRGKDKRWELAK